LDIFEATPHATPYIVDSGALENDPFVLVDVGCALGIDPIWNVFGDHLHAHGIDPQVEEIGRLRSAERRTGVQYHAAFVGLGDDHPFRQIADVGEGGGYFNPFGRSSTFAALAKEAARSGAGTFAETSEWHGGNLAGERLTLDDFFDRTGLTNVDLIKVDTDGADLEVVLSAESSIRSRGVLGFIVEATYIGGSGTAENTFHNVDRHLKQRGYMLYNATVHRYARAALPGVYEYDALACGTVTGQPIWGDFVYLRDGGSPDYFTVWGDDLSAPKILKLIALYELCRIPDCAAETILRHENSLAELVDVERLLDLLTPPLNGRVVGYREYLRAFEADPRTFYPSAQAEATASKPTSSGNAIEALRRRVEALSLRLRRNRRPRGRVSGRSQ
jgi:hypothetical protein